MIPRGNAFLSYYIYYEPLYGVEVVDEKGATVYPVKDSHVELRTGSPEEIDAAVSGVTGVSFIIHAVTPSRLGLRVTGPGAYTLRIRYQTRGEGCRILARGAGGVRHRGVGRWLAAHRGCEADPCDAGHTAGGRGGAVGIAKDQRPLRGRTFIW